MQLYKNLLEYATPRINEFCKNAKLFENSFSWSSFNEQCYCDMYDNNYYPNVCTVKELKEKNAELRDICKKCGSYYMNPRNKSIVIYDVMFGKMLEDVIIDFMKEKLHINAVHGDTSNKKYPDCMVLGPDKGIVAYFEVKYHAAPFISAINKINRYCYEGSATLDYKKIVKQLEIIDSDIERPVFYLHWIDYPCIKGIFFETSEQVKDYIYNPDSIFERERREGDNAKNPESIYLHKIYSPLLKMGTFEEFVDIINEMRR